MGEREKWRETGKGKGERMKERRVRDGGKEERNVESDRERTE